MALKSTQNLSLSLPPCLPQPHAALHALLAKGKSLCINDINASIKNLNMFRHALLKGLLLLTATPLITQALPKSPHLLVHPFCTPTLPKRQSSGLCTCVMLSHLTLQVQSPQSLHLNCMSHNMQSVFNSWSSVPVLPHTLLTQLSWTMMAIYGQSLKTILKHSSALSKLCSLSSHASAAILRHSSALSKLCSKTSTVLGLHIKC